MIKQYVADAFTDTVFGGNPAAVCVMDKWLEDETMLKMAIENNLSETAFLVKEGKNYRLRWFTPGGEIDLCGHATLASAFIVLNYVEKTANEVHFDTLSGELIVYRKDGFYEMDFPAYSLKPVEITDEMVAAIGVRPIEAYIDRDLLCVFENEDDIINMRPDMDKLMKIDGLLLNATAKSKNDKYDCISRCFCPKLSIPEDPVTGSAHCMIVPYWADKLGKKEITGYQASKRGGTLYCKDEGSRVKIGGNAVIYSIAEIYI